EVLVDLFISQYVEGCSAQFNGNVSRFLRREYDRDKFMWPSLRLIELLGCDCTFPFRANACPTCLSTFIPLLIVLCADDNHVIGLFDLVSRPSRPPASR